MKHRQIIQVLVGILEGFGDRLARLQSIQYHKAFILLCDELVVRARLNNLVVAAAETPSLRGEKRSLHRVAGS